MDNGKAQCMGEKVLLFSVSVSITVFVSEKKMNKPKKNSGMWKK